MTIQGPQPPTPGTARLTFEEIRRRDEEQEPAALDHPISRLKPGVVAPNAIAVAGTDGHLFIGDGANRWERQYRGELTVAENWLTGWSDVLDQRAEQATRRRVALLNLIMPEKQVIHPEKRWPGGGVSGEGRPLNLLLPRLSPRTRVLYGADALLAAAPGSAVWFRRNSHCNSTGCCAVIASLARALDAQADFKALRFSYRERPVAHDLAAHFFDPAPLEIAGFLDASVDTYFNNRAFEATGRHAGASYGLRNDAAPDERRIVVFGDSYAYDCGLTFALAEIFRDVVFVWSKSLDWDLIEKHRAEVVIWESAERFLATLPHS